LPHISAIYCTQSQAVYHRRGLQTSLHIGPVVRLLQDDRRLASPSQTGRYVLHFTANCEIVACQLAFAFHS